MRKWITFGALALITASAALPALAQDAGDTPADDVAVVKFGGFKYDLFPDEPVQACVTLREEGQGGASLAYRLFIREEDGSFSSVGEYDTPAIGALTNARYGDCVTLEEVP